MNKLGSYISKLMTTVIDKEQEQFVKDLALNELEKLNADIIEFIRKHKKEDDIKQIKETEKQLLQEDKKNVKNK